MKKLQLIDMTLRQENREMTFKEKLEIARSLDRLKVDALEVPPISGSKADQLANRTIASMISCRISAAVELSDAADRYPAEISGFLRPRCRWNSFAIKKLPRYSRKWTVRCARPGSTVNGWRLPPWTRPGLKSISWQA